MLPRRRCAICGKRLELLCRSNQIYCSKECNQRAFRLRHREQAQTAPSGSAKPAGEPQKALPNPRTAELSGSSDMPAAAPVAASPKAPHSDGKRGTGDSSDGARFSIQMCRRPGGGEREPRSGVRAWRTS